MPKSKNNKKSSRKNRKKPAERSGVRSLRMTLVKGDQMGSESGAYQRSLSLASEEAMRNYESQLVPLERKVFRTWMLCNVPRSVVNPAKGDSFIDFLMSKDLETFRAIITAAVMGALHGLWSADGKSALPKFSDPDAIGARFAGCVNKRFRNVQFETYGSQVRDLLYSDYLTLRLGSMVDWEKLLDNSSLAVWAKNCAEMLERFADKEQLSFLRTRRDAIITELADMAVSIIRDTMQTSAEEMRESGISCSYRAPQGTLNNFREQRNLPDAAFPLLAGSGSLSASRLLSERNLYEDDEFSNEALCECTVTRLACGSEYENISLHIMTRFTQPEIAYAAFSLLAQYRATELAPAVIQSLFGILAFTGFPCGVIDYGYTTRDYRKKVVLDTAKLIPLDEKQRGAMLQMAPAGENDVEKTEAAALSNINLSQFIYSSTGVIAPPALTIRLREARVLESYGLSKTDAVALCGYMEALRSLRRTVDYMADSRTSAEWMDEFFAAEDEPPEEERLDQIRQEVENELKSEIAAARELQKSTETERRKLMREQRTSAYRAEKAEQRLEEMAAELARLREEAAMLTSERNELQNALLSISEEKQEVEQDELPNIHFPSEIGKGIRFVVFGGSQNWIAEQHRRFPNIDFYDNETLPNTAVVGNADILMLNTFVMHHKYFWMIQDAAKRRNVPLRYFTSKGINRGSEQIIEAYEQYRNSAG